MIDISNVSKTFFTKTGQIKALDDVSLHVDKRDIYGIIGFSGAGKSTLLRLVNKLETPDEGSVFVAGHDLKDIKKNKIRALRQDIGMVFQQFNLLEGKSVFHNVALPLNIRGEGKQETQRKVKELLDFVELKDKENTFVSQLSGGQKQRVGIARALATDPKILLCDEATSALDPQTTLSILALLKKVNSELGITILLITHQMQVIQSICNKVSVMDAGKIVEKGNVIDVFSYPKQAITRHFVDTVVNDKIPKSILKILKSEQREAKKTFAVYKLKFVGESVKKPVISTISNLSETEVNILCANVQEAQDEILCIFVVQIIGTTEAITRARKTIDTFDIITDEVNLEDL